MTNEEKLYKIIEIIASLFISIGAIVCALFLSVLVFKYTKGRNFSDVGVPVYTHMGRACLLALITYVSTIVFAFFLTRLLWKSRDFMYVYGVVNFFSLMIVFVLFGMISS